MSNYPGRGQNLSALFPALGIPQKSNITAESLPPGFIIEYGAQMTARLADWHQAKLDGALEHAKKNPIIIFLLPAGGYVG